MVEWVLEQSDGQEYHIEPDDWDLFRAYDEGTMRPAEATLKVSRRVPAWAKQWIRAVEANKTIFLGYIDQEPAIDDITKSISAKGVEALLFECPCPVISLPYDSADMQDIFSDSAYPGLIYAANSYIPPGWLEDSLPAETDDPWIAHGPCVVIDGTNGIVKLANCGSKSRIGTKTICVNGIDYTEQASYATAIATDRSTYRDVDDLWIHYYYNSALEYGYKFLPLYALNAFDTRCRMGTIESTYAFPTPIKFGPEDMVGEMLAGIATVHGLNMRARYSGKLCYIDALEDFEDDGIFEIHEDLCNEIRYQEPSYNAASSLTGIGACPRLFQQMQSIVSTKPGGAFVRATQEFPEAYYDAGGNLCPLVTAQWSSTLPKNIVSVTTDRYNGIPIGASCLLKLIGKNESYQLKSIKRSSKSSTVLELGSRSPDILDALNALGGVENAYAMEILPDLYSVDTLSGTLTVGASNKAAVEYVSDAFSMCSYASVSDYNPRVLADISLKSEATGMVRPYNSVAIFRVKVGTAIVPEAYSQHYVVDKDNLKALDITSKINWGGSNTIKVYVKLLGALPSASDNSDFSVSVDVYVVGRRELT